MNSLQNRLAGLGLWLWLPAAPAILLLHGCTAREENAGPGSPLYSVAVMKAVEEQSKGRGRGPEGGRPDQQKAPSVATKTDRAILDFIKTKQPLDGGRIGVPDDLDAAVVFLLGPDSKFVTGQVLAVDGGWSVSEGRSLRD